MKRLSILLLVLASSQASADVFKCIGGNGKTVYQEKPCEGAAKGRQLNIEADPDKEAEAKARLESLQIEVDSRRAERLKAEKEAAEQRNKAEQVDALRRSAVAQQQQAIAAQRQAEALEQQNRQVNTPYWFLPGHSILPRSPDSRRDHEGTHEGGRRHRDDDKSSGPSPGVSGR